MKAVHSTISACLILSAILAAAVNFLSAAQPARQTWRSSPYLAEFHIVIPEGASPTLQLAGEKFKAYWEASTRRRIAVSHINEGSTNIWLGADAVSEELAAPDRVAGLAEEEYLVRTYTPPRRAAEQGAEKQLLIIGGGDQGVLHGVHAFFTHIIGVRWLAPGVTDYGAPPPGLQEFELIGRPEFAFREIGMTALWEAEGAATFRQAHALTESMWSAPGHPTYFDDLEVVDPAEDRVAYGASHGARLVLQHILDMVHADEAEGERAALLRERRRAAQWPLEDAVVWRLAAMDWLRPMLAPEGRALNESEESPAAAIVALASEVAEGLVEALPGETHWVHVLLSPAVQAPPRRLRAHPHVIVQLSTRSCNFAVPLTHGQCVLNSAFVEQLRGWRARGARVHVLDHMVNMRDPRLPFPHFRTVQSNLLLYARHNVEGVYYAGVEADAPEAVDLAALRIYLTASLLNDPDVVYQSVLEDFLARYYGLAAPEMSAYLSLMEQALAAHGAPLLADDAGVWLSDAVLAEAQAIVEQALNRDLPEAIQARVAAVMDGLARLRETEGG